MFHPNISVPVTGVIIYESVSPPADLEAYKERIQRALGPTILAQAQNCLWVSYLVKFTSKKMFEDVQCQIDLGTGNNSVAFAEGYGSDILESFTDAKNRLSWFTDEAVTRFVA